MLKEIRIDEKLVHKAVDVANQMLPIVTLLAASAEARKSANIELDDVCERGFNILRVHKSPAMLRSVRNFVAEQHIDGKLDSVSRKLFSALIGVRETGDLDPEKYALYCGKDGFRKAYSDLRKSEEQKLSEQVRSMLKGRDPSYRLGVWKGLYAELSRNGDSPVRDASEVVDAVIAAAKKQEEPVPA